MESHASSGAETVRVSVPGKVILMGEHAAVYGCPALVAALDLRLRVELAPQPAGGAGVVLDLPDIGHRARRSWSEILDYAARARERWNRFAEGTSALPFAEVRGSDPDHGVQLALAEGFADLETPRPDLELRVSSEIPVGAGFGSSAALAVAVLVAARANRRLARDVDEVDRQALEVERRQHGTPSGVDSATVLRGGVLFAERGESGLVFEPLPASGPFFDAVRIFSTGSPRQDTGTVVSAVRERWSSDGERRSLLRRMEAATRELRCRITARESEVLEPMREFESCLETLGVVPPAVQDLIRKVERQGGAAKISGAGALSGRGAGSLMVYHPEPEAIARWEFLEPLAAYRARLGAEGAREEVRG